MFILLWTCFVSVVCGQNVFELNILHYNDFHARFVETSPSGNVCNPSTAPCIGGFARLTTAIKDRLQDEPHSLLLNAGDSFQGTIWYNLLRWNVTQDFMNMLPHDAHTLGNHEFDNGIAGVVPYLEHLNSPVVAANVIADEEETIQGLIKPSIIVERHNRSIGIIGVLISTTNVLAQTGDLRFADEVETVRNEAEKLHNQEVDIIVVLSHCGIDIDRQIAQDAGPHIDIIVGGHSHTLLYTGEPPSNSGFTPEGPYPAVVDQENRQVLIVQAAAHTQYLGEIKLFFDGEGNLQNWIGAPHYIGNEIEQDPDVIEKINAYLPEIDMIANVQVGYSLVQLSSACACQECNLGNLICDAFLNSAVSEAQNGKWNSAHFCFINRGSIRAGIDAGAITFEHILVTNPFENNVERFELRGDHIMEMLEYSVSNIPYAGANMLQVSGIHIVYNGSQPVNERVVDVKVRCIDCEVPVYEPLKLDQYYKVVTQSFLGEGGDGFSMIPENRKNITVLGVDYDILRSYIEKTSPIYSEVEGRIQIENPCAV